MSSILFQLLCVLLLYVKKSYEVMSNWVLLFTFFFNGLFIYLWPTLWGRYVFVFWWWMLCCSLLLPAIKNFFYFFLYMSKESGWEGLVIFQSCVVPIVCFVKFISKLWIWFKILIRTNKLRYRSLSWSLFWCRPIISES